MVPVVSGVNANAKQIHRSLFNRSPKERDLLHAIILRPLGFIHLVLLLSLAPGLSAEPIVIPAGSFYMGCSANDRGCDPDEGPAGGVKVFVDQFAIDQYEVSVADYRACVQAGQCTRPKDHQRNKYCNYAAPNRDDHPLNCVDWQQASDFCQWQGGRLAYEAEWEKAARAGTRTRYPWGDADANCRHAIMDDQRTTGSAKDEYDGCGDDHTAPRGSRPPNQYKLYDMHGGIAEWVQNWYQADSHTQLYAKGNLQGPAKGERKVIKGGAWDEQAWALTSSGRWAKPPTGHPSLYGSNGIRCVYSKK